MFVEQIRSFVGRTSPENAN